MHGKVLVPCGFCYETGLQCFEISSSWGPPMWPRWRTRVCLFEVQYFVRAKESEGPFVNKALFGLFFILEITIFHAGNF